MAERTALADVLIKPVELHVAERATLAAHERELISALDDALQQMGYRVLPRKGGAAFAALFRPRGMRGKKRRRRRMKKGEKQAGRVMLMMKGRRRTAVRRRRKARRPKEK